MLMSRLDHWLNANSSLAVGSLTGPFPLDPLTQGSYAPMAPPPVPGPMGMRPPLSHPGTPMAPPLPSRMSWDGGVPQSSYSMGGMGPQATYGAGPSSMPISDMNLDMPIGNANLGHGGHGHGHGHVSGEMMFDPGMNVPMGMGMGMGMGLGVGGAAGYGLGSMGMGMGDIPVLGAAGSGENADEYWNALIDGESLSRR